MPRKALLIAAAAFAVAATPGESSPAQNSYTVQTADLKSVLPGALEGVGIDQRLNQSIPLNLVFKDESGRAVPLYPGGLDGCFCLCLRHPLGLRRFRPVGRPRLQRFEAYMDSLALRLTPS